MSDARQMAPDMRTTADFIMNQPRLHFACHIRNVTPQAVSIPVEPGLLERQPRLDEDAYRQLIERNRAKVAIPPLLELPEEEPINVDPPRAHHETQAAKRFADLHEKAKKADPSAHAEMPKAPDKPQPASKPAAAKRPPDPLATPEPDPDVSDEW